LPDSARGGGKRPVRGRSGGGGSIPVVRVRGGGIGAVIGRLGGGGSGPVEGRLAGGGGVIEPVRFRGDSGSGPVEGGPAAAGRGPDERRGGGSGPVELGLESRGSEPEPARGTGGRGPVLARPSGEVARDGGTGGIWGGCETVAGAWGGIVERAAGTDAGAAGEPFAPGFFFSRRENFS
jgi:hypothetical protein